MNIASLYGGVIHFSKPACSYFDVVSIVTTIA